MLNLKTLKRYNDHENHLEEKLKAFDVMMKTGTGGFECYQIDANRA